MTLLPSDVLYILVRYASPMWLMLTLSGPVDLLFLLCFIAAWTGAVVSVMLVVCSMNAFPSMCPLVLCALRLTVLVNCLPNAPTICVGEVNVLPLGWAGFPLANPCFVFQRVQP